MVGRQVVDSARFDGIVRALAGGLSRRAALGAALGGIFGSGSLARLGEDAAAKKKGKGKKKKCKGGKKKCGKKCISATSCCANSECGTGGACVGGVCACAIGFKNCEGACIRIDSCCTEDDCGDACAICQSGVCTSACDAGETCLVNGSCGKPCDSDEQCANGTCKCNAGQGDGICRVFIGNPECFTAPTCTTTATCPEGTVCSSVCTVQTGSNVCLPLCDA
jgi:hypothetical protein